MDENCQDLQFHTCVFSYIYNITFKSHLRQIFILTRAVENKKNIVVGKPQKMILFIISTYSEGLR